MPAMVESTISNIFVDFLDTAKSWKEEPQIGVSWSTWLCSQQHPTKYMWSLNYLQVVVVVQHPSQNP